MVKKQMKGKAQNKNKQQKKERREMQTQKVAMPMTIEARYKEEREEFSLFDGIR